jgi:hypothetical protein
MQLTHIALKAQNKLQLLKPKKFKTIDINILIELNCTLMENIV